MPIVQMTRQLATIPHCSSKGELAIHVNDDAAPHSALKKIC